MYSRSYLIAISLVVFTPFKTLADYGTQTNWSGGPGELGPVYYWSNRFCNERSIDWYTSSQNLSLTYAAEHIIEWEFYRVSSVHVSDIDGDGDMDVIGASSQIDEIAWFENDDGSGVSWIKQTITDNAGPSSLYAEDIDGDGDMDVVCSEYAACQISWWENCDSAGTSWTGHIIDEDFNWASSIHAEDIDGDGDMDIVGGGNDSVDVAWWENDGSSSDWPIHVVEEDIGGATSVYSHDINGDGYIDIVAMGFDNKVYWWNNTDGSGTSWIKHTVDEFFNRGRSVYVEDVDGDGDQDVLGAAWVAGEVAWWENIDGSGVSWIVHVIDSDFFGARSVYSQDLDTDGDMDVLAASIEKDEIKWWENVDGSGTSWIEHSIHDEFTCATSVYSEDIDGDGDMDVVGAALWINDIRWWDPLLTGYSCIGILESSILDTIENYDWDYIVWNSVTHLGTSISFQVRASNDYTVMGEWSDTLTVPCSLSSILNPGDRYVQYKTILESLNPDTTPILNDVTITWYSPGGSGSPDPVQIILFPITPNPLSGRPLISFGLTSSAPVFITLFDISGRLIQERHENTYSAGYHDLLLDELSPGIYFCSMTSGKFAAIQRFIVIE